MLIGQEREHSDQSGPLCASGPQCESEKYTIGAARCRAFTLIEIMVVLTILAALMAMGFGGFRHLREKASRDATQALVEAIANGIAARGPELTVRSGDEVRSLAIWDVDRDGLLDGQGLDLGPVTNGALLRDAGYAGLTPAVAEVPDRFRDAQGRPIDAWGQPLRYAYAPNRRSGGGYARVTTYLPTAAPMNYTTAAAVAALDQRYGAKGFVVWSAGPDGNNFTADDIYAAP